MPARLIDPLIVQVSNLNYNANSVIYYQRSTVILTELILGTALLRFVISTFSAVLVTYPHG